MEAGRSGAEALNRASGYCGGGKVMAALRLQARQ